jgi:hypothetical protein
MPIIDFQHESFISSMNPLNQQSDGAIGIPINSFFCESTEMTFHVSVNLLINSVISTFCPGPHLIETFKHIC